MPITVNQRVGNFKTNKVGTVLSPKFSGASGEFHGYVVATDLYGYEVWDDSNVVPLPAGFENPYTKSPS
jgi:hypothetical protein